MSRLINESLLKMLEAYDEQVLNKNWNPYAFYQIVQLAAHSQDMKIKNKKEKNYNHSRLYSYLTQGDIDRDREIINKMKIIIDNDRGIINKYLEEENREGEDKEEATINIYDNKAIGYLSWLEN